MPEMPRLTGFDLAPEVAAELEAVLPRTAEQAVAAIIAEVPAYADPFQGRMGHNIENAVQASLGAFLRLTSRGGAEPDASLRAALAGAYDLGRGEARNGRSIDALLAAYRVGARESWRELSATAVQAGLAAATIARFAALVFAYIDELSAASVSGHADELATAGRVRQRYLDLLARQLLDGEDPQTLRAAADTANWPAPQTLTAVLAPAARLSRLAILLAPGALQVSEDLPGLDPAESWAAVLVPDVEGARRAGLLAALSGHAAVVGPARIWTSAAISYRRAVRARHLAVDEVVDTDAHLVELVLGADADAAADLRARALAPLTDLGAAAPRLVETLRSWLLHQGRRDAVAAELFVHPQTVRYRMNQIRQVYGDRLNDPGVILELTVAVGIPAEPPCGSEGSAGSSR